MSQSAERREGAKSAEYAPQELTKLLLWSFHMSQGSGAHLKSESAVHSAIFRTMFALHPQMAQSVRHWVKSAGWAKELKARNFEDDNPNDDNADIRNTIVEEYVQEVYKYRESHAHAQGPLDMVMDHRGQAHKALKYFLVISDEYLDGHREKRKAPERLAEQEHLVGDLAQRIIHQDVEILDELASDAPYLLMQGPDAERIRAGRGHSMFCQMALSLKRAETRGFLPKEYQDLWERMGEYVREKHDELPEKTQKELMRLMAKYEETTGEEIVL